ncbi:recombinase family protein [Citrobacter freundii]|uniref:recombinase family protein n=1 Tax=Citrobacter freundii TaxID=546 RepID=UPI001FFE0CF4|nr:recombinase family protein [Citrobacter freundii]
MRNLSSAEGEVDAAKFSAFAEFEKSRIIERTKEGLVRAEGREEVRRPVASDTLQRVQEARAKGLSQSKAALVLNLSPLTIKRNWNIKEA